MKRRITALALAAAVFGLSACSGNPSPAEQTPVAEVPVSAPEDSAGPDAETLQACRDLAGPFSEASSAMAEIASGGETSRQDAVDMWTALVDALGSVADSASDQEVRDAAAAAQADFASLRDAMQKVYVDGDLSAMGEFTAASTAIQRSYAALLDLCAPGGAK